MINHKIIRSMPKKNVKSDVRPSWTFEKKKCKLFFNWLVSVQNWPKLLSKYEKAINMTFYMLFCMQIKHKRTEQCLLNT